jgi:hypothetical protein
MRRSERNRLSCACRLTHFGEPPLFRWERCALKPDDAGCKGRPIRHVDQGLFDSCSAIMLAGIMIDQISSVIGEWL